MYNPTAHHPEPAAHASASQLPQLYTEHDVIWYLISPWLVQVSYSGSDPSLLLVKINPMLAKLRTRGDLQAVLSFSM